MRLDISKILMLIMGIVLFFLKQSYWLISEPEKKTITAGKRWKGGDTKKSVSENGVTTTRTEASTTGNYMIQNI